MTVARSVADVLADHVVFEVESIDRMYLNVWQPRLQPTAAGCSGFSVANAATNRLHRVDGPDDQDVRRRHPPLRPDPRVPWVHFAKGQRKDDLAHEFLARFDRDEGVLFVGRAQEKAGVWRTQRRRDVDGGPTPGWCAPRR